MNPRWKELLPLVTAMLVWGLFTIPSEARAQQSPVFRIKHAAYHREQSLLYVLNGDSTISAYDAAREEFVVARKALSRDYNYITVSPSGRSIAFVSTQADRTIIDIVVAESILKNSLPKSVQRFGVERTGRSALAFSNNDDQAYLASSVSGKVHLLNIQSGTINEIRVGENPVQMEVSRDGSKLFVLNINSNSVSVVDVASEKLTKTIPVGKIPSVLHYDGVNERMYVVNSGSDSVSVIDTRSGVLIGGASVGRNPVAIAFDPSSQTAYVANSIDGTLSIISPDLRARTVPVSSPAYFQSYPLLVSFSPAAKRLLVVNGSTKEYSLYTADGKTLIKTGTIRGLLQRIIALGDVPGFVTTEFDASYLGMINAVTGGYSALPEGGESAQVFLSAPQSITVDEDANKIYVSNLGSDTITVIDGATHKPTQIIKVAQSPQVMRLNPATKKLYITSPVENLVTVIDTGSPAYHTKVLAVGKMPRGLIINEQTNKIYITNSGEGSVSVIDGNQDAVIKTISLSDEGRFPLVIQVNQRKNEVYVANYGGDTVAVIDGKTDTLKQFVNTGRNPIWVRYLDQLDQLYVTVEGEKKIIRINPETYEVVESFTLTQVPYRIFFDEKTRLIYVNHRKDETVTIIKPAEKQSGRGVIIAEKVIPYYGQTDTVYNMLFSNQRTGLAYVTYGRENQVLVFKINRVGREQILEPAWFATIQADGRAVFNPALQPKAAPAAFRRTFPLIGGGLVVLLALIAFIYWSFLRKEREAV